MNELWYPPSFVELDLERGNGIKPEDIASYAYPPGTRQRYTEAGWQKAIALGHQVADVPHSEQSSDVRDIEHDHQVGEGP